MNFNRHLYNKLKDYCMLNWYFLLEPWKIPKEAKNKNKLTINV